jgi:diguanylate cyclase (GGDEF)-like protein
LRLRTLSFILLTTIALVPSLILSLVIYQKVYQLVEMAVEQKLERVAKQINSDVLHQVELLTTGLNLLSEQKLMRLGIDNLLYSEQILSILNNFGENNPLIESLYLISNDGFVVESYAGNILALEASPLIKLEPDNRSLYYSNKQALQTFVVNPWIKYFENPDLLKNDAHGIAFVVPIASAVKLSAVEVHGYLLAIMPVSKMVALAAKVKTDQERVNFSVQGKVIAGDLMSSDDDAVIKSSRIGFSSSKYRNILWLDLNVAQSRKAIITSIHNAMSPVLSTGAFILVVLILVAIVIAHLFSNAFNQLNRLLRRFELGAIISSKPFFILEFKNVNSLLRRLQKTINQQMRVLEDKNGELLRVNLLREKYLAEVRDLNAGLEQQVQLRTSELANTLSKVEHSHFVFEQLILFRRLLESCAGNRAVAETIFNSIDVCLPGGSMAVFLPKQLKHRSISNCYNMQQIDFSAVNEQLISCKNKAIEDKKIIIDGKPAYVTCFSVGIDQSGWLMIKNQADESENNSWLMLFITELRSYFMMRTLNEDLDMLANTDSLTELKNRKAFDYLLAKLETQSGSNVALYIIDINGLKAVNDEQGHEQGDILIKEAASVLNRCAQDISQQVFRIGGDEFAIIVTEDKFAFIDKLTDNLTQQQLAAQRNEAKVSFSFGYASTAECAFSMLYKSADSKMYIDKGNHYRRRKGDR